MSQNAVKRDQSPEAVSCGDMYVLTRVRAHGHEEGRDGTVADILVRCVGFATMLTVVAVAAVL